MQPTFDHIAKRVPDIAEAVAWYQAHFANCRVLHLDPTWGFIEVGGVKLAFVLSDQHPNHVAWRVDDAELERLALQFGKTILPHRDRTRSFYIDAPGGESIELISYPPDSSY